MADKQLFRFAAERMPVCLVGRSLMNDLQAKDGDCISVTKLAKIGNKYEALAKRMTLLIERNASNVILKSANCQFLVCNKGKDRVEKVASPVDKVPWFVGLWNSFLDEEPTIINDDFIQKMEYIMDMLEDDVAANGYSKQKSIDALKANMGLKINIYRRGVPIYDVQIRD